MEQENKLSVFVGKFSTQTDFEDYLEESYDDDGEMISAFMTDFDIEFYDADFSESLFTSSGISQKELRDFSYANSFVDQIDLESIPISNSILIIYGFAYDGSIVQTQNFEFLGNFDYES